MVPGGKAEGVVLDSLINRITDTLIAPFRAILDFLTDPTNMLAVGKRIFDALENVDTILMGYSLPSLFVAVGLVFLLLGLAKATFQVVLGQRGVVGAFGPIVLPVLMFPLFAYRGASCKPDTGSFPCIPEVSYNVEVVSGSEIPAQKIPVLEYGVNGQLTLGFREKPLPDRPGYNYAVFQPELPPMPGGTAIGYQLLTQSYLLSRRIFYSELSIYEDSLSELRDVYSKLMHSAFNTMAAATFTSAGIRGAFLGLITSVIPEKGKTLFQSKGLLRKIGNWLSKNAPSFLRGFFNFTFGGAENVTGSIAYKTATLNLTLIETLAAIPLLLVSFYLVVVYGVFVSAKVFLYGAPLFLGLATFFPKRVASFFSLLLTLIIFPPIFGAFMGVSMRTLFISGIKAQVERLNDIVQKSEELFFLNNPAAAYMGGMVASAVATQAENALACLNGSPPADEGDGKVSPYGYILQSTAGSIACYPSYNVKGYLKYADDPSGLPTDPGQIQAMALEIARAVSLDVAGIVGDADPNTRRKYYALPKGGGLAPNSLEERIYGLFGFGQEGVYGGSSGGFGPLSKRSLKEHFLPPSFWNSPAGEQLKRVLYMGDEMKQAANLEVLPPLEIGALTRLALDTYARPDRKKLEVLVKQLKSFVQDLNTLAARGESLKESGDYANDFYKTGIRWEIAWPLFLDTPFKVIKYGMEGGANLPPGINLKLDPLLRGMATPPPPIPVDSPVAPYSLSLRLTGRTSGGTPPPKPRVVPDEVIAPISDGALTIPKPEVLTPNPNFTPSDTQLLPSFFKYDDLIKSPPSALGYRLDVPAGGEGSETIAPYLAYPYLEHYSIMNQLGEGLLTALRNIDAQKLGPLIFLVVAALLAYFIFTTLLSVSQTLLEGMGASSGPLARALQMQFLSGVNPFQYFPQPKPRPVAVPNLAPVGLSEGASSYMVQKAVNLIEERVGSRPDLTPLPHSEVPPGEASPEPAKAEVEQVGHLKEPTQKILDGLREVLGGEAFRTALVGEDAVVVYGTDTEEARRYTPSGLAEKLLQLMQEWDQAKKTWSSLAERLGEATRSWEIRLVEEAGLVGLETGAKSYAYAKEALTKEGYVVEEVKPGKLAVIYDSHRTPLGYLRLAPLFRGRKVASEFNEFVAELSAERAKSERAKWYMSLEKVEGLPYQRALTALAEPRVLREVERSLRKRMGESFVGLLPLLGDSRGRVYVFYRDEGGGERALRLDFVPFRVDYEGVESFRLAVESRNLPGVSAKAYLEGGRLAGILRAPFFREGEFIRISRALEDSVIWGESLEARLRNAGVGIEEVGLYLARLKEFFGDDKLFEEAKGELEKIRSLYVKEGLKGGATEVLAGFVRGELKVLERQLSQIEESVEREYFREGGGLASAALSWRKALIDLEREVELLKALRPGSKSGGREQGDFDSRGSRKPEDAENAKGEAKGAHLGPKDVVDSGSPNGQESANKKPGSYKGEAEERIRGGVRRRSGGLSDGDDNGPSAEELLERIAELMERFNPKDKRELN
jgi:hypothetical protein